MSDSGRRNEPNGEHDGTQPLAEFPSELASESVPTSSPHGAASTRDEPDSSETQASAVPLRPSESVGARRWPVAGHLAALADTMWVERLVVRSRDALRGLVTLASHLRPRWPRQSLGIVGAIRKLWTRAVFHERSRAGAPPALWSDVSSRAGHAYSGGSRVQRRMGPLRARPVMLFLAGVVVGAALMTAVRWPFTAMATTAASNDQVGSAVAESLPAAPSLAGDEVREAAANGAPAQNDSGAPDLSAQEEAAGPPDGYHGSLVINSEPRGAEVFVNGQRVGKTPLVLDNLHIGSRAVRLRLDGHESWSRAVDVVADQRSSVLALLQPSR